MIFLLFITVAFAGKDRDMSEYLKSGTMHFNSERYEQAIADYSKAIKLDLDFPNTHSFRASAYMVVKQYNKAITDYTKYIKLAPASSSGYFDRAKTYEATGDKRRALNDYQKAIEQAPTATYYKKEYERLLM